MTDFTVEIHFPRSRSKYYLHAINLAADFDFCSCNHVNMVITGAVEVFSKWDSFNKLFWIVVDWRGSVLVLDGKKFYSHSDKTRIFYSLQEAHSNYVCRVAESLYSSDVSDPVPDVDFDNLTSSDADMLIEQYEKHKKQKDPPRWEDLSF